MSALPLGFPALRDLLSKCRQTSIERDLQDAIESVLLFAQISYEREVSLTPRDRIDFLVVGGIGLEVKIKGGPSDVTSQLHRYAQHERITSLVLVTTRYRHSLMLPSTLNGKPVNVIHVSGGML